MANKLVFETGLDGTGFERGLHSLGHSATHNLKSLVAGAFGLYGIHQILHRTVESAEELINTSKRLGEVPEKLQVMRQAAKEGGLEFGKLAAAYDKVNIAREKALGGNSKLMAAFGRFGISERDLRDKSAGELLRGAFRDAIKSKNPQDLDAPGAAIFGGRGFGSLIPVLTSDFEELEHKMTALGSIMSTETAVALKQMKDEFDLLSNIIVAQLAPALVGLVGFIIDGIGKLKIAAGAAGGFSAGMDRIRDRTDAAYNSGNGYWDGLARSLEALFSKQSLYDLGENTLSGAQPVEKEVNAAMKSLADHLKELADALKHPPKPTIAENLPSPTLKRGRSKEFSPDSLLAVGNFLGGAGRMIDSIAQQQLDVARQQLTATQEGNETLKEVAENLEAMKGDGDGIEVP